MRRGLALSSLLALATLLATPAAPAGASPYVPGEVLVHRDGEPGERVVELPDSVSVPQALRNLRQKPGIDYAVPNYEFRAAGFDPNDPGRSGQPHGWRKDQWNFLAPTLAAPGGIDAPEAWQQLIDFGRAGGRGVRVAVLDTGVAYRRLGRRFRRDPDLPSTRRFVKPRDFVDGDRKPLDLNGHGTHVTSTIVQKTDNARGLTGLAYRVKVIPVRVLNRRERGNAADLARGIRDAVKHGADVINLSIQSGSDVTGCAQIPGVCRALRRAHNHGVTVVAAAGNGGNDQLAYPGRSRWVIGVGATTYDSCLARYSNHGSALDLVAPGGGSDLPAGAIKTGNPGCGSSDQHPQVVQFSLKRAAAIAGNYRRFGFVGLHGTSMATAHTSAAAARVLARGRARTCARPRRSPGRRRDATRMHLARPRRERLLRRRLARRRRGDRRFRRVLSRT